MKFVSFLRGRPHERPSRLDRESTEARFLAISRAVGETLRKHGIPASWIGAETLPAKTPSEQKGVHLRLVVRKANPKLFVHLYALQHAIQTRLGQVDAHSPQWLMGTSWRLDLPLGTDTCKLPGPAFWEDNPRGQVTVPTPAEQDPDRHMVARQIGARDRAFAPTTWEAPDFLPTQPVGAR